jgi:hypothetical protein
MYLFCHKSLFPMALMLFFLEFAIGIAQGQVTLRVDMDPISSGIQNTRVTKALDNFQVEIYVEVGAGGLDIYGVAVQFGTNEADLSGVPASTEISPPTPLINLTAGVESENEALGVVCQFEGATLTVGAGPANTGSPGFSIGRINFTAPIDGIEDGIPDVSPGMFCPPSGLVDNSNMAVVPTVFPGYLIPEPRSLSLFCVGAYGLILLRRISWIT